MQPFFSSTRASMISWPTTNWRWRSGFSSSRGIEPHEVYRSAAGPAACFTAACLARRWGLAFLDVFDFAFLIVFFAMASVYPPSVKLHRCIVQIGVRHLERSRFCNFILRDHLGEGRG